jgi:hypothetical protein
MLSPVAAKTGPGRYIPCYNDGTAKLANAFDHCLSAEKSWWDYYVYHNNLFNYRQGIDAPWLSMGSDGVRLFEVGSIPIGNPPYTGLNQTTLTFNIPEGYDAVIDTVICQVIPGVAGTGFIEGSGAITWRLSANLRYLFDCGKITFSRGSMQNPVATSNSNIRVYSGNHILGSVSIAAAAAGVLAPDASVLMAVGGYQYPR